MGRQGINLICKSKKQNYENNRQKTNPRTVNYLRI